jgi:cobalamin biosynthesis Mg chelatase CobN
MRLDAGLIAPLRRLSSGVLRRPRFDYGLAMKLGRQKSFDNLANEIIVLGRSESITISNSADIAGVEFTETAGNVAETAILGSSTAGSSSPSETTQPPKVDSTGVVQPLTVDVATVIASPVKIADNVTRVDITLTDSSDDLSALSMSLDGTTWVPVPRGQPVSLNRTDVASLQVRSVNSKGEVRQVVQKVVSNASGESSSNVSGTVSDGSDSPSSSKLWIVVVILVLLILVAVLMRGRRSKAKD